MQGCVEVLVCGCVDVGGYLVAWCVGPLTSTHQHINTSTHQHINTSTHQHINTSTHQHINTSTHQHINTSTHQHTNTPTHKHINTLIKWQRLILEEPLRRS